MTNFGDRVRILVSPETLAAGLVGQEGETYGFTTPEHMTVDAIVGGFLDGYAVCVSLDPSDADVWIRPDLIELVHRNPGVEVVLNGMRLIRQADGSWLRELTSESSQTDEWETDFEAKLVQAFKSRRPVRD